MDNGADNCCLLLTYHKLPLMNRTARRETECRQSIHKIITSLHSKRYRPSGMLIDRQNSYAPCSRRCTGRRESKSREPVNKVKKLFVVFVRERFSKQCIVFVIVHNCSVTPYGVEMLICTRYNDAFKC
jgi:hypothetical protein